MASLWLTTVPDEARERPLATLKALREALRAFDADAGIEAAEAILEVFYSDGFAHLGDSKDLVSVTLHDVRRGLLTSGCCTKLDLDPDKLMTTSGASPEDVFRSVAADGDTAPQPNGVQPAEAAYQTAMVLMANLEGNPLKAASVAIGLARTTRAVPFYTEVVASMVLTFPWLEEMLKQQKLLA